MTRVWSVLDLIRYTADYLGGKGIREPRLNAELLLAVVLFAGTLLAMVAFASSWVMRRYARELERSESALRQANEGLEAAVQVRTLNLSRANEEIQRFAYIVSHDLRSPLVNIMGFTSELEAASKPLREMIAEVDERAPGAVSVEARAAVETDLPESPVYVVGDADNIGRVIGNLLSNAVKYTPSGGRVRITCRRVGDRAEIAVSDTGLGISERDQKDLFKEFFRSTNPDALSAPGTGLGLAIVQRIVERHDGTIRVTSTLGEGSTFTVRLPLAGF